MIRFFRKYTRQFALLMTVVILNLSIDAPDPVRFVNQEYSTTEDLSVNQIESISEWILEGLLNIPNAVPEQNDHESASLVKHFVDYYFVNNHFIATIIPASFIVSFRAVHSFTPSFWKCETIFGLIKPPRL